MLKIALFLSRKLVTYFCLLEQINTGARQSILNSRARTWSVSKLRDFIEFNTLPFIRIYSIRFLRISFLRMCSIYVLIYKFCSYERVTVGCIISRHPQYKNSNKLHAHCTHVLNNVFIVTDVTLHRLRYMWK